MKTIAQIADVRNEGSLSKDSSDTGFLQDEQIQVALNLGQQTLLLWVDDYETVRDYAGVDAATIKKKAAYSRAECYFTIGAMVAVLNNQQLAKTGLLKSKKTGESEVTFSNVDDAARFADFWSEKAFVALYDYLGNNIYSTTDPDPDADPIGFRTKDKKLSFVGI